MIKLHKDYNENLIIFREANIHLLERNDVSKEIKDQLEWIFRLMVLKMALETHLKEKFLRSELGIYSLVKYTKDSKDVENRDIVRNIKNSFDTSFRPEHSNFQTKALNINLRSVLFSSGMFEGKKVAEAYNLWLQKQQTYIYKIIQKILKLSKVQMQELIRELETRLPYFIKQFANQRYNKKYAVYYLQLFEASIIELLPYYTKLLNLITEEVSLSEIRKDILKRSMFSGICWNCGKQHSNNDLSFYCRRANNYQCYIARQGKDRKGKQELIEIKAATTNKNTCKNCGRRTSLDHIHTLKGELLQFCSETCYQIYRKSSKFLKSSKVESY